MRLHSCMGVMEGRSCRLRTCNGALSLQGAEEDMHVSAIPASPAAAEIPVADDNFADLLNMTPIPIDLPTAGGRYSTDSGDFGYDENAEPDLTALSPLMQLSPSMPVGKPASAPSTAKQPLHDAAAFSILGLEQHKPPSLQPLPQASAPKANTPRKRGVWGAPKQTMLKSSFAAPDTPADNSNSRAQAGVLQPT